MLNKMIVMGEKETFIVRVLIKKVMDAGIDCCYVPYSIDEINSHITDGLLIAICIDDSERPKVEVLHFLVDKMMENGLKMIIVGDQSDKRYICDNVPGELIHETFTRPVDNMLFVKTVTDYFKKMNAGEFKKSILIVDDDPQYLMLVREWLRDKYKVSMANSGLQAIKWLGKNKVDLILLDHEMPITSGPQVLEMLRNDEETKSIPVMFLTGKGDKESVMAVVALKPEGYFLKSILREELIEKLDEYFALHK